MILIEELVFFQEMIVILGTYLSQIYLSKLGLHSDGWWGKGEPIHISAIKSTKKGNPGMISDITFNNINANSESGVVIYGENINSIKNIKMNNLRVKADFR